MYLNKNIVVKNYNINTYWECGTKIDLNFAIDLTISNGNFKKGEHSLHFLDDANSNHYTKVMETIGRRLINFVPRESVIGMVGFGA